MSVRVPKHISRLVLLLVLVLLGAYAARSLLVDPSYYRFGHYRADAVPEIASQTPLYQGSDHCRTCHAERNADWARGAHKTVQCEVCHGIDHGHPDDGKSLIPADKIKLCTTCHLAITGRPAKQPQIVLGEHPFPGEETPQCHTCHNPHSPGEMREEEAAPGGSAAVNAPAEASKCAKCHGQNGEGVRNSPPLAGMPPKLFIEHINEFKSGSRKNRIMAKFANSLTDEEIAELANYYASLPEKPPE